MTANFDEYKSKSAFCPSKGQASGGALLAVLAGGGGEQDGDRLLEPGIRTLINSGLVRLLIFFSFLFKFRYFFTPISFVLPPQFCTSILNRPRI